MKKIEILFDLNCLRNEFDVIWEKMISQPKLYPLKNKNYGKRSNYYVWYLTTKRWRDKQITSYINF
jgi:hypothetical protein